VTQEKNKCWFVYILECNDGTLYTGITTNVERRLNEHNTSKRGAKYTRTRRPVKLAAIVAICEDRATASRKEYNIKKLKRSQKIKLIKSVGLK
jgi:putative endonuclease